MCHSCKMFQYYISKILTFYFLMVRFVSIEMVVVEMTSKKLSYQLMEGGFFLYMDIPASFDKPFKTYDEMLRILEDRNIIKKNKELARCALENFSYYGLINGYKAIWGLFTFFIFAELSQIIINIFTLLSCATTFIFLKLILRSKKFCNTVRYLIHNSIFNYIVILYILSIEFSAA